MAGTDGSGGTAGSGDQPQRRRRRRRRRPAGGAAGTGRAAQSADAGAGAAGDGHSGAKKPTKRRRPRPKKKPSAATATSGAGSSTRSGTGSTKRDAARGRRPSKPRRKKIPTTREVSAGGVVYRFTEDGAIEVVLASRRTRRGQLAWGLAKGGIEQGESKEEAALREVREETGLTADIEADLGDTKYMYVWDDLRIRKTVHFFLMRHTGGNVDDRDDEMEEIRWFPLERAIKRAAYRGERDMLVKASELLR